MGIVFVSTNLDFSSLSQGQLAADALLIISGVAWALFMIYNKKLVTNSTSATFQNMTWVLDIYLSFRLRHSPYWLDQASLRWIFGGGRRLFTQQSYVGLCLIICGWKAQISFSLHVYGSAFIRNRGSHRRLNSCSERAYNVFSQSVLSS